MMFKLRDATLAPCWVWLVCSRALSIACQASAQQDAVDATNRSSFIEQEFAIETWETGPVLATRVFICSRHSQKMGERKS